MQKVPSEVLSFAKAQGFDLASYVMEWEGFSVYVLGHDTGGEVYYTGYPVFVLVNEKKVIREATDKEMHSIIRACPDD